MTQSNVRMEKTKKPPVCEEVVVAGFICPDTMAKCGGEGSQSRVPLDPTQSGCGSRKQMEVPEAADLEELMEWKFLTAWP